MNTRIAVLIAWLIAGGAGLHSLVRQERVPPRVPLASLPASVDEWRLTDDTHFDAETLAVLKPDDYVARRYERDRGRSTDAADLYVGFYETQRRGDTIHSPMNCLPGNGWQPVSTARIALHPDPESAINANEYIVQKGLDKRLVVYWYQSHGRTVASEYWSKAYLVWDALRINRTDGALVRVITPIRTIDPAIADQQRTVNDFVRAIYPSLRRVLPG